MLTAVGSLPPPWPYVLHHSEAAGTGRVNMSIRRPSHFRCRCRYAAVVAFYVERATDRFRLTSFIFSKTRARDTYASHAAAPLKIPSNTRRTRGWRLSMRERISCPRPRRVCIRFSFFLFLLKCARRIIYELLTRTKINGVRPCSTCGSSTHFIRIIEDVRVSARNYGTSRWRRRPPPVWSF